MNYEFKLKRFILFLISVAIILGGVCFDAQETNKIVENISYISNVSSEESEVPLHGSISAIRMAPMIAVEAEVNNKGLIRESLRRVENSSNSKRTLVITLILLLYISFGSLFLNVLPSVFPWTDIITSRRSIISYIHMQDGAK